MAAPPRACSGSCPAEDRGGGERSPSYLMAELQGHLSRSRDRDLKGREYQVWTRRALLLLLVALIVAALLNVFGQRSTTSEARASAATLTVKAPQRLRGGLIFEGRFEIQAHRALK